MYRSKQDYYSPAAVELRAVQQEFEGWQRVL
jgi:hypothetical protein